MYRWHSDSGHGWLEIPAGELDKFSIKPSHYSYYSFANPEKPVAYLEEDCDAPALLAALEHATSLLRWSLHDQLIVSEYGARQRAIEMAEAAAAAARGAQ